MSGSCWRPHILRFAWHTVFVDAANIAKRGSRTRSVRIWGKKLATWHPVSLYSANKACRVSLIRMSWSWCGTATTAAYVEPMASLHRESQAAVGDLWQLHEGFPQRVAY
eukprot:6475097-Amphidinium_carterae.2